MGYRLYELRGSDVLKRDDICELLRLSPAESQNLSVMLSQSIQSPITTSAGRLFDGLAALAGVRLRCSYEGQAAIELEHAARAVSEQAAYPFECAPSPAGGIECDWGPMAVGVLADRDSGVSTAEIAARIHCTLSAMIVSVAQRLQATAVALSGGCFQNARLVSQTVERLQVTGVRALWHRNVPPNDGGISVGQIAYAVAADAQNEKL